MSLINQMLTDLDQRGASAPALTRTSDRARSVQTDLRPVPAAARRSRTTPGILGVVGVLVGGAAGWVMPGYFSAPAAVVTPQAIVDGDAAPGMPILAGAPDPAEAGPAEIEVTVTRRPVHTTVVEPFAPVAEPMGAMALRIDPEVLSELQLDRVHHRTVDRPEGPPPSLHIERQPDDPDAIAATRYEQARGLLARGDTEAGITALRDLLAAAPGHEAGRATLIQALLRAKQLDAAASELRTALAIADSGSDRRFEFADLLARLLLDRGDVTGALATLRAAMPDPRTRPAYYAFAAALEQRTGNHAGAIDLYQRVLAVDGGQGTWWLGLGISLAAAERQGEAAEAFRRALLDQRVTPDLRQYIAREMERLQGGRA